MLTHDAAENDFSSQRNDFAGQLACRLWCIPRSVGDWNRYSKVAGRESCPAWDADVADIAEADEVAQERLRDEA